MFNLNTLLASLIWGSIGTGLCLYGQKKTAWVPFVGGIGLILLSCVVTSVLWMSVDSALLIVAMSGLMRRGY